MLIVCWIWLSLSSSLALEGQPDLTIRTHRSVPHVCSRTLARIREPADPGYLLQPRPQTTPSTCSTWSSLKSRRATSRPCLKTSFSRGVRLRAVRQRRSMPPTKTGRTRNSRTALEWTRRANPASRHHLLFTIFAEQAQAVSPCELVVSLRISNICQ